MGPAKRGAVNYAAGHAQVSNYLDAWLISYETTSTVLFERGSRQEMVGMLLRAA